MPEDRELRLLRDAVQLHGGRDGADGGAVLRGGGIREYRKNIDETKKKEFEGRFTYEPYEVVMASSVENNLKYFDINVAFKAYPLDGQPFYDEVTGQHREFIEGGTVYRVYENNQIQQIQ